MLTPADIELILSIVCAIGIVFVFLYFFCGRNEVQSEIYAGSKPDRTSPPNRTVIEACTVEKLIETIKQYPATVRTEVADEVIDSSDDRVVILYNDDELDIFSCSAEQLAKEL